MKIIYGTGNDAKVGYMRRVLRGLPLEIVDLRQAAAKRDIVLPEVEETGATPLENARQKAEKYFELLQSPVFSCDSGLYLWEHGTGRPLPEEAQPGIHVRGRGEKRYSDDELLAHYIRLVKEYGLIRARYKNAIALIWDKDTRAEEDMWGEPFLFTDVPHKKRVPGFPLDSISLDMDTQRYFYDLEGEAQDGLVSDESGFARFFRDFLEKENIL